VLTIEPTGAFPPAGPFDHVFFLSEQAVRHGGDLSYVDGARVHAVGGQTAARLSEAGVAAQVPDAAASEGLIEALVDETLTGAACLIVAGEGGRKTLADHLRGRSARVSEYLCYRRVAAEVATDVLAGVTHILVASQDGFRVMARLWCSNGGDSDVRVIAASDRIAALGPELGFSNLSVAAGAADADFIAALEAQ
jgi:uroporphyrinogen-III synthase